MTALVTLFLSTRSDWTDLTIFKALVRKAAVASYFLRGTP